MTEQENEFRVKTEVAEKPETRALPSNPDEEMGAKNEEAGKTETECTPSDRGGDESNELKEAVTEQENEFEPKLR